MILLSFYKGDQKVELYDHFIEKNGDILHELSVVMYVVMYSAKHQITHLCTNRSVSRLANISNIKFHREELIKLKNAILASVGLNSVGLNSTLLKSKGEQNAKRHSEFFWY
jgi:hypothetical protein